MDGMFRQRILDTDDDPNLRNDVRLIMPSRRPGVVEKIDRALALFPEGSDQSYRRSMIRGGLASCLVYVGWREVLIRPFIPPTSENEPFTAAVQRIYLSATLGRGGELERAFGRTSIQRLPLPEDAQHPRSGRRFFIFNDLTTGDSTWLLRRVVEAAGKALILAPSHTIAQTVADECNPLDWPVLTKDDIAIGLAPFAEAKNAVLALAGRYDGLDLPGDACRLVVFDGLPEVAHLQERFLASRVRAAAALEERIRTRVVQGAGRCTRGPSDHAVVVLRGADLVGYLSNTKRRDTLDPDLQAEVQFGLMNSRGESAQDVAAAVDVFLAQGDQWRTEAEPSLVAARRAAQRRDPDGSVGLTASAPLEVAACHASWRTDYFAASRAAQQAAQALGGDDSLRPYRGLWLYLASVWSFAAAGGEPGARTTASGLLKRAVEASRGTTWLKESDPGDHTVEIDADDTPAVRKIAARLANGTKRSTIEQQLERMITGLAAVEATKVEPALTELGLLLGADASKPQGQARCDSAWCWDKRIWLTLEAKTEHHPDGEIPVKDVRQAGSQLRSLEADRGVDAPDASASIVISPRTRIAPDALAAAENHVHLVHPDAVRDLAVDVESAWNELLTRMPGHSGPELQTLIRRIFSEHHVLPTQALERLTVLPVRE